MEKTTAQTPSIDLMYSNSNHSKFTVGRCVKCNSLTVRHSDDDHIINGRYEPFELTFKTIEGKSKSFVCDSNHDHGTYGGALYEEIWHICTNCGERSLECPDCHKYCRLILFSGQPISDNEKIDGCRYRISKCSEEGKSYWVFVEVYYDEENNEYEDASDENVNHSMVPKEMKVYSLNAEKWYLNGCDGSQRNVWECDHCGKVIENYCG